jgi:hypothetical protein
MCRAGMNRPAGTGDVTDREFLSGNNWQPVRSSNSNSPTLFPIMSYHRQIILFIHGCCSVTGQRLTGPFAPLLLPDVSWAKGYEPARTSIVPCRSQDEARKAELRAALGKQKISENIDFPKLNGKELAAIYQKHSGRRVIVSTAASTAEFRFIFEAILVCAKFCGKLLGR